MVLLWTYSLSPYSGLIFKAPHMWVCPLSTRAERCVMWATLIRWRRKDWVGRNITVHFLYHRCCPLIQYSFTGGRSKPHADCSDCTAAAEGWRWTWAGSSHFCPVTNLEWLVNSCVMMTVQAKTGGGVCNVNALDTISLFTLVPEYLWHRCPVFMFGDFPHFSPLFQNQGQSPSTDRWTPPNVVIIGLSQKLTPFLVLFCVLYCGFHWT